MAPSGPGARGPRTGGVELQSTKPRIASWIAGAAVLVAVAGCGSASPSSSSSVAGAKISDPVALYHPGLPGLKISVFAYFASGTATYTNPDSIAIDANNVFIGFQNVTAKDGSDNKTSTIVQYTLAGRVVTKFTVPGHNDGLRVDPRPTCSGRPPTRMAIPGSTSSIPAAARSPRTHSHRPRTAVATMTSGS
jgi:hypothetical protein